jgi:hypothetical protein
MAKPDRPAAQPARKPHQKARQSSDLRGAAGSLPRTRTNVPGLTDPAETTYALLMKKGFKGSRWYASSLVAETRKDHSRFPKKKLTLLNVHDLKMVKLGRIRHVLRDAEAGTIERLRPASTQPARAAKEESRKLAPPQLGGPHDWSGITRLAVTDPDSPEQQARDLEATLAGLGLTP